MGNIPKHCETMGNTVKREGAPNNDTLHAGTASGNRSVRAADMCRKASMREAFIRWKSTESRWIKDTAINIMRQSTSSICSLAGVGGVVIEVRSRWLMGGGWPLQRWMEVDRTPVPQF